MTEPTDAQIEMARTVLIDAIAVDRPHNAAQYRVDYRSGIYACEEEAIRAMFAFADAKQSTDPISYEERVEYESRVLTEEIKIVRLMRAVKALSKVARDLREHRESPSYSEDLDDRYINDLLNAEDGLNSEVRAINHETGQYYYIRPE